MRKVDFWPIAKECIDKLPAKYQRQIAAKIVVLCQNPEVTRSKLLEGFAPLRRFRSGDYRIVYFSDAVVLTVVLVDKRNDDTIYRRLKQMFR